MNRLMKLAVIAFGLIVALNTFAFAQDSDADGILDATDACPGTKQGALVSGEGCSVEQTCPCAGPKAGQSWQDHVDYVTHVAVAANALFVEGVVDAAQFRAIVANAARSRCGTMRAAGIAVTPRVKVVVDSPLPGELLSDSDTHVQGRVINAPSGSYVRVNGIRGELGSDGTFLVSEIPLDAIATELEVVVYQGIDTVASGSVTTVNAALPESGVLVSGDQAGFVEVTELDNPLYGAMVEVPLGSATRPMLIEVSYDPEHAPVLPSGIAAAGPFLFIGPEAETFEQPVRVVLPYSRGNVPPESLTTVKVLGLGDDGWIEVAHESVSDTSISLKTKTFALNPLVVVYEEPLLTNEVFVVTNPPYATIYLDGANTGMRSPVILQGVANGNHEIKAYVDGFNEVFASFTMTSNMGKRIDVVLEEVGEAAPTVEWIDESANGSTVASSFIELEAIAKLSGVAMSGGTAVLSVDENDTYEIIQPNGTIKGVFALQLGENFLHMRVNGPDGSTGVSKTLRVIRVEGSARLSQERSGTALQKYLEAVAAGWIDDATEDIINDDDQVPPAADGGAIQITLTWGTNDTDIDLHVFDPAGNHAWYGSLGGIPGGALDRDDTDGFGPEIFSMLAPRPGVYRVAVDAYSIEGMPTVATLTVRIGDQVDFSGTYLFTQSDGNATNGQPGGSPSAFWDADRFVIGTLEIVDVRTSDGSSAKKGIFTTAAGENVIEVTTKAPDSVADNALFYDVTEIRENYAVNTDGVTGRKASIVLEHKKLTTLVRPKTKPLAYAIVAYTKKADGSRDLTSPEKIVAQDDRSQIRQEYVDKRVLRPDFVRSTPARAAINDPGTYKRQTDDVYQFVDFSKDSDYSPKLAVIGESRNIANRMYAATNGRIRLTSGWRNPRNNDNLDPKNEPSINSFHQTGGAVDFNPHKTDPSLWLPTDPCTGKAVKTYSDAQKAIHCIARDLFGDKYGVKLHGDPRHLHIEYEVE
jgi:hypothetical protein